MNDNNLTHFDAAGNAVMVDVSVKPVTTREAIAHGIITMNAEAFAAVQSGTVKKGDVLGVARIAGIMATKRTSELIPLCHPLPLTKVSVDFRLLPQRQAVEALCTVKTEVPSAVLTPEWGIVSDAHGGSWHRQVSLLSAEKIEAFRKKIWVDYGAFGENLVIEGFDFRNLPVTSRFAIGDVVLEMTQIGKECHNDCVIKQQTGECIMPREGVFARVLTGGEIHVGDEVTLLPPLENPPLRAAVITLSDKGSRGEREDKSGPLIVEMLTAAGYVVEETMILPDEAKALKAQLIRLADGRQVNLILTTGGTGFSPRDITPEATCAVADRNAPGIAEAMRYHSLSITPRGMLSRGVSVLRGKTLIVNLPGSPKAVQENLEYILPSLEHGVRIAAGLDGECARK